MSSSNEQSPHLHFDVTVVGAGFGGCYLLKKLRESGLRVQVFEAGTSLGGVWSWNRYPGARVDCEFPYYGFSDPAIWSTFIWKERFPDADALRGYFQHVDKVWDLSKDVILNTRVTEAKYFENGWTLKTSDGQVYRSKWFIPATGTSFKQYIPDWKGVGSFQGPMHHSSLWPAQGADIKGKRVAIIGAGSTGIQVVQEAAKVSSSVTQFIRSPNLAVPMRQRDITVEEIINNRPILPHMFKAIRTTRTGLPVLGSGRMTFNDSAEERELLWEEQWLRGGFNWGIGSYIDVGVSKDANRAAYDFWARKTRARITNPKKRDLLAPLESPYYVGTKRPSLEQDYYEMCDRQHVEITDAPIEEIKATGILASDKFREFDIIVICTGYDAVTGGLRTMGITGRDGVDLNEKWKEGVVTNLGMVVNGFPNMFMVYGPQAPTSLTNGPPFIEMQCEWILDTILKQQAENLIAVEAKAEAEAAWRDHVLELAGKTLAIHTNSWYMGANVPGKKREYLLYMGGIPAWHQACEDALEGWKAFDVVQPAS